MSFWLLDKFPFMVKFMECKRTAEWFVYGNAPDDFSYSCTKHLPKMVFDGAVGIALVEGEEPTTCCFIH